MATTRLSNLKFADELWNKAVVLPAIDQNFFTDSGIAMEQSDITTNLNSEVGGSKYTFIYQNPLLDSEPNVGTDNPADTASVEALTDVELSGVKWNLNKAVGAMDLARELRGTDPMGGIETKFRDYWSQQISLKGISMIKGLIADNVANDSSDMVNAIGITTGTIDASNLVSGDAVIDAEATIGDQLGKFVGIGLHSVVYNNLRKQQLIDTIRDADNNTLFEVYDGKRVFVSDQLPVDTTVPSYPIYTTVLFGMSSFGYGTGSPIMPVEVDRTALSGNGSGQETIVSRVTTSYHPNGFNWVGASMAGVSPTNAELADPTNWDRIWDRKRVAMAFLTSNG